MLLHAQLYVPRSPGLLQGILLAVNKDGNGPAEDQDKTGPTDDGQIITAVAGLPADPYCCQGPEPVEGGEEHSLGCCPVVLGQPCKLHGALGHRLRSMLPQLLGACRAVLVRPAQCLNPFVPGRRRHLGQCGHRERDCSWLGHRHLSAALLHQRCQWRVPTGQRRIPADSGHDGAPAMVELGLLQCCMQLVWLNSGSCRHHI